MNLNRIRIFRCLLLLMLLQQGVSHRCIAKDVALQSGDFFSIQTISFGATKLSVEIASTDAQRKRGLMYRTHLDEDKGMLFLMPKIGPASFWMKDTLIPLSIAYLNARGTILEIEDKKALDTTITHNSRPLYH